MGKELEALEKGIIEFEKDLEDDCNNEWLKRVVAGMKKCYQRLEAIDSVNPSEALERIKKSHYTAIAVMGCERDYETENAIDTIKQYILKSQEQEKEFAELKENVKRWHDLLLKSGIDSKGMVAFEIEEYWAIKAGV